MSLEKLGHSIMPLSHDSAAEVYNVDIGPGGIMAEEHSKCIKYGNLIKI